MGSPNVHYIAIGTELLNGHRLNTNAQYLGRVLAAQLGLSLSEIQAIPDDPPRLIEAINNSRADVVITSGGLGPTEDDKTTEAICSLLKCGMAFHQDSITQIKTALASRGEAVIKTAILQARYPKKPKACLNPVGLAPAFYFDHGGNKEMSLPGAPQE
ncbi:MAG: competence/damage-inducible protein A, partial [Alphaproteobacteria bacterium]|nr:competence/damage-inducible protein A [Alphaproteobacteria bacterium]